MFEYTTETILNDNVGHLDTTKDKRFVYSNNVAYIEGVGRFEAKNVTGMYYSAYAPEVAEEIKITVPTTYTVAGTTSNVAAGDVIRLMVSTRQEGLTSSIYADTQLRHIKPFFYEIKVGTATAAGIAADLVTVISNEMAMTDFSFFKASAASGVITLKADDCYTRFVAINMAVVPSKEVATAPVYGTTGYQNYTVLTGGDWKRADGVAGMVTSFTEGTEGNGTVRRIIKNLRMPTLANIDPFGLDFGGKPIPNGEYNIYTIEYCTDRYNVGHDVLGSVGKSLTTHVFYVEKNNLAGNNGDWTTFWTALSTGASITPQTKELSNGTVTGKTPEHPQVG